MAKSGSFHTQLTTIMDIMTKTALAQICRLFEEDSAAVRREMSRVMRENKLLRDQLRCLQYELIRVVGQGKKGPHKRAKLELHPTMGTPTGETYRGVDKDNMGINRAPSINGIFGKEWCMNLWNDGEAQGCTPADAEPHSGFVEEFRGDDQEQIEQLTIKEEESEVDINERNQQTSEGFIKEGGRWVSDRSETSSTDRHYTDVVRRGGHSVSVDSSEDFESFLELSGMLGGHNPEFISLDGTTGDYTILPPPAVSPTYDPHCEPIEYEYEGMEGETQLVAFEGLSEIPSSSLPRVVKSQPAIKTEIAEKFGYFDRFEARQPPKKRKFHCKLCGKTYVKYDTLKTHMRIHKREKFYRCRICKSVFPQKNLLRTHKCTVVPSNSSSSSSSSSSSNDNNNKDKNKQKDKIKKEKDKETVRTMQNNTVQNDSKDKNKQKNKIKKEKDKETVRTMPNNTVQSDDKDHVRKYIVQQQNSKAKGKNSCEYCGRCFTTNTNLRVHYAVHTGERPHKCDICGKTFTQKGNMNIHRRIHTGEKPFVCPVCHKCFSQKINLRQHVVTHGQKYALKKGKRYVIKKEEQKETAINDD